MNIKFQKNALEFLTIIVSIFSITYMTNSILINGFDLNPISYSVGTMISLLIIFIKNMIVGNNYEDILKIINVENNPVKEYGLFISYLIILDLCFYILSFA